MSIFIKTEISNGDLFKDACSAACGSAPSPYARYRALAGLSGK